MTAEGTPPTLADMMRAAEEAFLLDAITATRGDRTAAARRLGITPRQLFRRLAALELHEELDDLARAHGWFADGSASARAQRARRAIR